MNTPLLLIGLTLLGALSPLLTFARFSQLKEWRWDRLEDQLHHDGYVRHLFGIVRPVVIGILLVNGLWSLVQIPEAAVPGVCAVLTIVQIGMRRQRKPVWTHKALTLVGTALVLTTLVSLWIAPVSPLALVLLILLQPVALLIAWLLWKPVDLLLKRRILAQATALRASHPELMVIGITGSFGKTTTKELLATVLQDRDPLVTPEHVNTEMGVAQWLIRNLAEESMKAKRPRLLVVEMGAYRKGEIALLCRIAKPTIGVLTGIGTQHLSLFGSEATILDAKSELLQNLPPTGHAFVNAENAGCREAAKRATCPVTLVQSVAAEDTPDGLRFSVKSVPFLAHLHGTHNISNVMLALEVGAHLGLGFDVMARHLRHFCPPPHAFEILEQEGVTILDSTYNSSPASFRACLDWARAQPHEQKTLLTFGIQELGNAEDPIMTILGKASTGLFERVFFTSHEGLRGFQQGFGGPVERLGADTPPVARGSLLVCIGRMPLSTIQRLLPHA